MDAAIIPIAASRNLYPIPQELFHAPDVTTEPATDVITEAHADVSSKPEKRTRTTDEIIGEVLATSPSLAPLWHERLGHTGKQKLKVIASTPEYYERGFVLSEKQIDKLNVCDSCMTTKIHKIISHKTVDRNKYLKGQVWHMDLTGRKDTPSLIDGNQMSVIFVEEVSRISEVYNILIMLMRFVKLSIGGTQII